MYKNNSRNLQRRAEAITIRDMPSFEGLNLTIEEKRDSLVAHYKWLNSEIIKAPKNSELRKQLSARYKETSEAISKLRAKQKGSRELPNFFIDAAKDMLSVGQFKLIMKEAFRLHEEFQKNKGVAPD